MSTGRQAFLDHAAEAVACFDAVAAISGPDLADPAVAEFAAQFALDVSAVDDGQRAAFLAATGAEAFAVVQQIYAHDVVPRVRAVLDVILGSGDWPRSGLAPADSWASIEALLVAVARLRQLDPTLTELIRLRGARLHDCAVCKSRRSQDALDDGADEATFTAVDSYHTSTFSDPTKAALALTDALIQTPFAVPASSIDAVREHLSEGQVVEVVLDVMRNAANKIAVALGADAATVTQGVELFTTDDDGNLTVLGTA